MNHKISIVIPVWNREKLVIRCLDSVLHQTVKPYEIIVVDNNSTDNTLGQVNQWIQQNQNYGIKFKLIEQPVRGACATRQKGLENVEGEFISFFDSDDVMLPNLLERVNKIINSNPEIDIICWKCRITLLDGSKRVPPFLSNNIIEAHLIHTLLRPQGYIVRKNFIEKAGGWNKPLKVWNDYELGLRLILRDPKIILLNEILVDIYSQEESITGKDFSSKEGEWEKTLQEMIRVNEETEYTGKDLVSNILNYRMAILAAHYYREGNSNGASKLMKETLSKNSRIKKLLLNFAYHYTRLGLRGAWRILRWAYYSKN